MGSLAGPDDADRLPSGLQREGDGGGRSTQVLLHGGDHSPGGVVGIAPDEEGGPDRADDPYTAAPKMLRAGSPVLVQVPDGDHSRPGPLCERHEWGDRTAIIDTAQRYAGLRTYRNAPLTTRRREGRKVPATANRRVRCGRVRRGACTSPRVCRCRAGCRGGTYRKRGSSDDAPRRRAGLPRRTDAPRRSAARPTSASDTGAVGRRLAGRRKPLRRQGSPSPCRQRASTPVVPLRASVSSGFPPPFEFGMPRLISTERGQGLNGRWLRLVRASSVASSVR